MRILIAGGGTGGHLFPGIAVAEALADRGAEVLFVGTERGLEARVLPRLGFALETIQVRGLARVSWTERLRFLLEAPLSAAQAASVLWRVRPDVAVGVGGYSSGPVLLAAALARIPTAILEQNSVPGVTNRLLSRVVDRIYCSFTLPEGTFPAHKTTVPGNPVRQGIIDALEQAGHVGAPATPDDSNDSNDGRFSLFVFGGSQGARGINETFMAAAPALAQQRLSLVHQTGEADHERVVAAYARAGLTAEVLPFIDNMAERYAAADLIVCRAGATTLAELGIVGRPAVLVPFPHATHNHQEANARDVERQGAAICLPQQELTGDQLASLIAELEADPARRASMGEAMARLGRPDAAHVIAEGIWALGQARRRA
jgi:UDP-N-acetylglucosamine--N-acetylmuramyl-(pentapeptide) pyrophosphoryl-undecaprenol N-acetylglucosamine transferase